MLYSKCPTAGLSSAVVNRLSIATRESRSKPVQPFADVVTTCVRSGSGGKPVPGAERSNAFRGPGYGGHGGSVYLTCCGQIDSLAHIPSETRALSGSDAENGSRGLHAPDLSLQVPLGTIVRELVKTPLLDISGGRMRKPVFLFQFMKEGQSFVLASGGRGGIAPASSKKADGRAPESGQRRYYELEMRFVSDCALVGSHNAGKSSLLAGLTRVLNRIGPEEGSTSRPHRGMLQFRDGCDISILDLPGIRLSPDYELADHTPILRHIWRSKVLIYVVDMSSSVDHITEIENLRNKIRAFDPANFPERKWLVVGTKCDLLHRDTLFKLDALQIQLRARIDPEVNVIGVSARFGLGLNELVSCIRESHRSRDLQSPSFHARADRIRNGVDFPDDHTICNLRRIIHLDE